jgi:hypothetical protein
MITITNAKVSGFTPRWAVFRGFSLLFDNPGRSLTSRDGRLELTCAVETDPELTFYRSLRAQLEALDLDLLTQRYLFCPLPPPSYHVTVWDGGNDGNVAQLAGAHRSSLEALIDGLPESLLQPNELLELPARSPLVQRQDWAIRFQLERLVQWGNAVLVAYLAPTDPASTQALEELTDERRRLTSAYRQASGIGPSDAYTPHISLGYFANQEGAEATAPHVPEWNRRFQQALEGQTITFRRVSLYGFTDMATFFKAGNRSE